MLSSKIALLAVLIAFCCLIAPTDAYYYYPYYSYGYNSYSPYYYGGNYGYSGYYNYPSYYSGYGYYGKREAGFGPNNQQ